MRVERSHHHPESRASRIVAPAHRPLAILIMTARYAPEIGGTEIHTQELAERLVARGHSVTVITTDRTGTLPTEETRAGVVIKRVRAWPQGGDYYLAPGMFRLARSASFDLVHIQGIHTFVAPLAMLIARRLHIPYVLAFHSGGHSARWRRAIRRPQFLMLRPLLVRAHRLIANSSYELGYFHHRLHIDGSKFAMVPVGAGIDAGPRPVAPREDSALVLSIGRLEPYKGHARLLEAWPAVLERIPDSRLVILGEGPQQQELEALVNRLEIEDSVDIFSIPASRREELAVLIRRAVLTVSLSSFESFGMAIREALSLGSPVLVSDIDGYRDLVGSSHVTVVPVNSPASVVAGAVVDAIQCETRGHPPHMPTWDQCVDAFEQIYRTALTDSR
jgi:glycosyltransferase involved in cell wall biosynthesis